MKKLLFAALAAGVALNAAADIKFVLPKEMKGAKLVVRSQQVADPRNSLKVDTIVVKKNKFAMPEDSRGKAQYFIQTDKQNYINFYSTPGENLVVEVSSTEPLKYTVKGSALMDALTPLKEADKAFENEYRGFLEKKDEAGMQGVMERYNKYFADFMKNNPKSQGVLYAMLRVGPDVFMEEFEKLDAGLKTSALYPDVERKKSQIERQIAAEKKLKELSSGAVDAPNFTLKNLEGKEVSLSDFRGKWVVIDFWGSWCGWCIKGFPALKKAYEQYKPELEVLGVDCNDPEDKWRKAVEKHQLPWVNVYNPGQNTILSDYGVTGFPTKAIISPEGKIANITVGEDPAFFETLAKLMGK